jgi:hypothetical protein
LVDDLLNQVHLLRANLDGSSLETLVASSRWDSFTAESVALDNGTGIAGDFNLNWQLDGADLDLFRERVVSEFNLAFLDLNGDQQVDNKDRRFWVSELAGTYFGDTNLDGLFDTRDLVGVFQAGQYEDVSGR